MESCVRDIPAKFEGTLQWAMNVEFRKRTACTVQWANRLRTDRPVASGHIGNDQSSHLQLDACQCQGKSEGGALAIIGTPGICAAVELAGANSAATPSR